MEGIHTRAWFAFVFALIAVWISAYAAIAAPSPSGASQLGRSLRDGACESRLGEVYFSARFRWEGGSSDHWFRLGPDAQKPQEIHAQIVDASGRCQATCKMARFEKRSTTRPVSMDLNCESALFSVLETPAALLWNADRPEAAPRLQFGSWAEGYRHVSLQVVTDRYSKPETTPRDLAAPALARGPTLRRILR